MSSADFQKVLVRDERLNCKDSIKYAVQKSGQNITVAEFNAISQNANSHTYNIQVPSETTIIDRRVIWESTVTLRVDVPIAAQVSALLNGMAVGDPICQLGIANALGPFPLHSACLTQQFTINNNSVSINMNDVLPAILRFNDKRELMRYNGMCPNMYDVYGKYQDAVGANNNPNGSYTQHSLDNDLYARGSFMDVQVSGTNGFDYAVGAVAPITPVPTLIAVPNAVLSYFVRYTVREPLLAAPFMFAKSSYSGQGFYGIQNLNVVFNLSTSNVARVWRSGLPLDNNEVAPTTCTILSYNNSRLIFNFLTPKPSDMLSARNVVPYYEMPRYLSTSTATIPYATRNPATAATAAGIIPARTRLTFTTTQLNQIPDKLLIFVRKAKASQLITDTDSALAITACSFNFNNQSGILASATQDQLYRFSVEAGSNQSWEEFRGFAQSPNAAIGAGRQISTSGSYLYLDMGKHLQITEDYYAAGSLGNFNLQFTLDVENYIPAPIASAAPMPIEMVLITLNSGLFVCEKGQSATYTGILTKDDVLSASAQSPHSSGDVERLVGGGLLDKLGSFASAVAPSLISKGKDMLAKSDNPYAQGATKALKMICGNGVGRGVGRGGAMEDRLM